MGFKQGDGGMSFGYKASGANTADEFGNLDTVKYINISQDDALTWPESIHGTYPRTVNVRMENTIMPFTKKSRVINIVLLGILERKMGLPEGEPLKKPSDSEPSGSEKRCIKNPPRA